VIISLQEEMMINSEKLINDYYLSYILVYQKLSVNILAVVFFKFSDTKSINQSILDISQARNQLGTPGGEEFSERGTNFWNHVQ